MQPPSVPAPDETGSRLLALVQALADELHGEGGAGAQVTLDTQFERDLGFDSLARAELFARVEAAFGAGLSVDLLATLATPRELLHALADSAQQWREIVQGMEAAFRAGRYDEGLQQAVDAVTQVLVRYFPAQAGAANPNELPDEPVLG